MGPVRRAQPREARDQRTECLAGLEPRQVRAETKLPIVRCEDPFTAVTLGAGHALDSIDLLAQIAMP